jgi:hypothetical protein
MSENEKISRRSAMATALTILGSAVATTRANANEAKINQAAVHYQDKTDPDGHHCMTCVNFVAPASCRLVGGRIDPNGSCLAYMPGSETKTGKEGLVF